MKPKRHTRRRKEAHKEDSPFFGGSSQKSDSASAFFTPQQAQAKLKVGNVNDPYEKQADATAHAVVNNSSTGSVTPGTTGVQRKEEGIQTLKVFKQEEEEMQTKLQKQVEEEEESLQTKLQKQEEEEMQTKLQKQEEEEVQSKTEVFRKEDTTPATIPLESRISQSKTGGQALPEDLRKEFEQQLGASFKMVRIHDDSEAHDLCEEFNALAFASGHHIFFKKGAYQPYSSEGKFLLVHELTHVIQQRNNIF